MYSISNLSFSISATKTSSDWISSTLWFVSKEAFSGKIVEFGEVADCLSCSVVAIVGRFTSYCVPDGWTKVINSCLLKLYKLVIVGAVFLCKINWTILTELVNVYVVYLCYLLQIDAHVFQTFLEEFASEGRKLGFFSLGRRGRTWVRVWIISIYLFCYKNDNCLDFFF